MMIDPRMILIRRPYLSFISGTNGSAIIQPKEYEADMNPSLALFGSLKSIILGISMRVSIDLNVRQTHSIASSQLFEYRSS